MKKEEQIIEVLINLERKYNRGVSALELGSYMKMDRANVSRHLNNLSKAGKIIKLNGRPVLYTTIIKKK